MVLLSCDLRSMSHRWMLATNKSPDVVHSMSSSNVSIQKQACACKGKMGRLYLIQVCVGWKPRACPDIPISKVERTVVNLSPVLRPQDDGDTKSACSPSISRALSVHEWSRRGYRDEKPSHIVLLVSGRLTFLSGSFELPYWGMGSYGE